MAFFLPVFLSFQDAEEGDKTCEKWLGTNVTVQTTSGRQQTGTYGYNHDYTLTGSQAIGPITQGVIIAASHWVLSFAAGVSAAPSAEAKLFVRGTSAHITIGTDRKLRFYNSGGTQVGTASTTLIPTTGMQEVHVVFDGKTLSTMYIKVYFGGTEELAFDTGMSPASFFNEGNSEWYFGDPNNSSNKGFVLYSDDVVLRQSSVAGDAVHLTSYPRMKGVGRQIPDAVGTHNNWGAGGAYNKYDAVADSGTHDGDTTYVETLQKGVKQTFTSTTANPIPSSPTPTIDFVQMRNVGKISIVGKVGAHFLLRRASGGDETTAVANSATLSTSYSGGLWVPVTRPSGGSWVRTDADVGVIEFGWESENAAGSDTGARVTKQLGLHWIYHTANLDAGTTPVAAAADEFLPRLNLLGTGCFILFLLSFLTLLL